MGGMLKEMIENTLDELIDGKYPHLKNPQAVQASICQVEGIHEGRWKATLKILDKSGEVDLDYPEIPGVLTDMELQVGDIVTVVLLYGECIPYIVGRWME